MSEEERIRAQEQKSISAQVGEGERKTILDYLRDSHSNKVSTLTKLSLIAGIATFLSGFLLVPFTLWSKLFPDPESGFSCIRFLLFGVARISYSLFPFIAIIGLVLSTLRFWFVYRDDWKFVWKLMPWQIDLDTDICLRLLPFAFVVNGIILYGACESTMVLQ